MDPARARRLSERITQIVAEMLERRIKDPRLGFVTITDTRVTGDLRDATVFYTVYGSDEEQQATAAALASATGVIRSEVGRQTGIKHTPSITFEQDKLPEGAKSIEDLVTQGARSRCPPRHGPCRRGARRRPRSVPRERRAGGRRGVVSESGLVIVDKSGGMTSHDVVARVRRLAGTRRVGHAGTLDPMATGVLVIGIEKATRLLGHLTRTEKEYDGTIRLGQTTVTDDAEGEVLPAPDGGAADPSAIPEPALRSALARFVGQISQVPPRISAIKVDGQRAYRLTRSGAEPELTARPVTISKIDLLEVRRPGAGLLDIDVAVTCSSGTYIRAIARDLGAALLTGGHLTALRRTRVGPYLVATARTLDQLAENFEITPLARAAEAAFETLRLTAEETRLVSHGGSASGRRRQPGSARCGWCGGTRCRRCRRACRRVRTGRHADRAAGAARRRNAAIGCFRPIGRADFASDGSLDSSGFLGPIPGSIR